MRTLIKTGWLALAVASVAVTSAASAWAQTPEGKVGIHYNRCDGNYDGWGIHLWKNPNIPLPGVEWAKPMMPTGKDDFGVLWQVDLAEFGGTAAVNYIIHKGDSKEQGGKDMKFDGKATREVWINSGDPSIHPSLDGARKARVASPCP